MASSATIFPTLPHPTHPKSPNFSVSSLLIPLPKTPNSCLTTSNPLVGASLFSPWSGLKHFGVSTRQKYVIRERGKCRRTVVYASLFGVGAPEALVIGVVALLVFGPKGLAEVARNLGKTLRAFQPTIKELQEVSRELKTSLVREMGLDEIASTVKGTVNSTTTYQDEKQQAKADPNGTPPLNGQSSSEDPLKATKEQSTVPPNEQQGERTLSPAELLISIAKGKTEAATTEEQPAAVLTEKKAESTASSDEPPQVILSVPANHETSVGAPSLEKLESERRE